MLQAEILLSHIQAALTAAGLSVVGVLGPCPSSYPNTSLTTWHQRAEGWFRLDWSQSPTSAQVQQAGTLVTAGTATPTLAEKLRTLGIGDDVMAAVVLRLSASWATATVAQQQKATGIIDAAGAAVLNIVTQS